MAEICGMVRNKTTKKATGKPKGRMPKALSDELKPAAHQLYIQGKTAKEVAAMLGIAEKTMGKWVEAEGWAAQRAVITASKPQLLKSLYAQCKELTDSIDKRPEGEKFSNSKEADSLLKLTAAIKNLEGEANIAQVVEVSMLVCDYVATHEPKHLDLVTDVFTKVINSRIQHAAK